MNVNIEVQVPILRRHATFWSERSDAVDGVRKSIEPAVGQGAEFGYMAGSNGVADMYNWWSQAMSSALVDAATSFRYLDAALRSAANFYDASDATAAEGARKLDRMLEASDYKGNGGPPPLGEN